MDYEKLHKDTIAKLQEMVNSGKITVKTACGICVDFVPESEDERIRKVLIEAVIQVLQDQYCSNRGVSKEKVLAWLEKQGENAYNEELSKLLHKVICHFINNPDIPYSKRDEVSNKVIPYVEKLEKQGNNMGISESTKQELEDNLNKALEKETAESLDEFLEKQGEQPKQDNSAVKDYNNIDPHFGKPTDKIEPKFKVGDVMRTLQEASDGFTDGMPVVVSIDDEYYNCTNELIAIKDQDDYEYPPMNRRQKPADEVGNYDHKEVLQTIINEQKPAWSEEDEKMIRGLIVICDEWTTRHSFYPIENCEIEKLKNWLESLKKRCTWKPSDEQMKALEIAIRRGIKSGTWEEEALKDLIEQLKKLREE